MPTDYETAYVTITERLIAEWATKAANFDGNGASAPVLRFYGNEPPTIPKSHFARFKMQGVIEGQRTFRSGEPDDNRYQSAGVIFLQVFAPRGKTALEEARKLGAVGRGIFRGQRFAGGILFRRVRVVDVEERTTADNFIQKNVVMEYEYDEIA